MSKTFIIGDVHGHYDRLYRLLLNEGIIDSTENRINHDVEVVQLGDLGHFGGVSGSPTGDRMCYEMADKWLDVLLWGNHDRAVIDESSAFRGYVHPGYKVGRIMHRLIDSGKLRMAHAAHGYLLTHAGLHPGYADKSVQGDAGKLADWINENPGPVWSDIGITRGGRAPTGGILWRDAFEKLDESVPQIFGHSAADNVRKYFNKSGASYCIDTGGKHNGRLAGIWLPDRKVVEL